MHHAGFRTIALTEFVKFVEGEDVDLPARPVLLTFDDARLDSWTGSDAILRELGFQAVMFVDVGRVADGEPEYMTWDELRTAQSSGRWEPQVHSGHGHVYVRYGPAPDETGPAYAYEQSARELRGVARQGVLRHHLGRGGAGREHPRLSPARVLTALRLVRPGRHERSTHSGRAAQLADDSGST